MAFGFNQHRKFDAENAWLCVFWYGKLETKFMTGSNRVATAQGKQGIWMLTFPDRENTGNLVNLSFTRGKLWQHRENCILVVEGLTCDVIVE